MKYSDLSIQELKDYLLCAEKLQEKYNTNYRIKASADLIIKNRKITTVINDILYELEERLFKDIEII